MVDGNWKRLEALRRGLGVEAVDDKEQTEMFGHVKHPTG